MSALTTTYETTLGMYRKKEAHHFVSPLTSQQVWSGYCWIMEGEDLLQLALELPELYKCLNYSTV